MYLQLYTVLLPLIHSPLKQEKLPPALDSILFQAPPELLTSSAMMGIVRPPLRGTTASLPTRCLYLSSCRQRREEKQKPEKRIGHQLLREPSRNPEAYRKPNPKEYCRLKQEGTHLTRIGAPSLHRTQRVHQKPYHRGINVPEAHLRHTLG